MPIDKFTKKPKGFAFVTFVIPENAVKAFAALDRQSFQVHCFALQVTIASVVIS
jgi:RNA recognition motif-containing protein